MSGKKEKVERLGKNEHWWIENSDGKLAEYGRHIDRGGIAEGGPPFFFNSKEQGGEYCVEGERVVKVRLVKVR